MTAIREAHERRMKYFQVLAHRGLVSEFVPENTTKAFADALFAGADVIETDVRATADGIAVIFHDEDLLRLAGIPKKVAEITWKEISGIDIGFGKRVPTLQQVLQDFPEARFNLDIKSDLAIEPVANVINALGVQNRILISSFSDSRRIKTLKKISGSVGTSAGSARVLALWLCSILGATPLFQFFSRQITALQIPISRFPIRLDSKRFVRFALNAGLELHYWTINDPIEIQRLINLGATGIVTDNCDLVISNFRKEK
jgi:glycerophosphoryl diester phosphodiesterase